MLVALFTVAFFATITNAMLSSGVAYAHVIARQRAQRATTAALTDGERLLRAAIATQMQSGLGDGAVPPIPQATTAPLCDAGAATCFNGTVAFTPAGGTNDATTGGSDLALEVQRAAGVGENRLAFRLTATVLSASGTPLATATRDVVVRTLEVAPYAIVTATSDASALTVADSAGCDGASTACAPAASAIADDTRLHTVGQCRDQQYLQGMCLGKALPTVDADTAAASTNQSWTNTTNVPTGWQR